MWQGFGSRELQLWPLWAEPSTAPHQIGASSSCSKRDPLLSRAKLWAMMAVIWDSRYKKQKNCYTTAAGREYIPSLVQEKSLRRKEQNTSRQSSMNWHWPHCCSRPGEEEKSWDWNHVWEEWGVKMFFSNQCPILLSFFNKLNKSYPNLNCLAHASNWWAISLSLSQPTSSSLYFLSHVMLRRGNESAVWQTALVNHHHTSGKTRKRMKDRLSNCTDPLRRTGRTQRRSYNAK